MLNARVRWSRQIDRYCHKISDLLRITVKCDSTTLPLLNDELAFMKITSIKSL